MIRVFLLFLCVLIMASCDAPSSSNSERITEYSSIQAIVSGQRFHAGRRTTVSPDAPLSRFDGGIVTYNRDGTGLSVTESGRRFPFRWSISNGRVLLVHPSGRRAPSMSVFRSNASGRFYLQNSDVIQVPVSSSQAQSIMKQNARENFDPGKAIISIYAASIQDYWSNSRVNSDQYQRVIDNRERVITFVNQLQSGYDNLAARTSQSSVRVRSIAQALEQGSGCQKALASDANTVARGFSIVAQDARAGTTPLVQLKDDLNNSSGRGSAFWQSFASVYSGLVTDNAIQTHGALRPIRVSAARDQRIANARKTIEDLAYNLETLGQRTKWLSDTLQELGKRETACPR